MPERYLFPNVGFFSFSQYYEEHVRNYFQGLLLYVKMKWNEIDIKLNGFKLKISPCDIYFRFIGDSWFSFPDNCGFPHNMVRFVITLYSNYVSLHCINKLLKLLSLKENDETKKKSYNMYAFICFLGLLSFQTVLLKRKI